MNAVKKSFRSGFDGCTMTSLFYSDEYCEKAREGSYLLDEVSNESDVNCISVCFRTDSTERGNGLEPDSNYQWDRTLLLNGDEWEVKYWGEC